MYKWNAAKHQNSFKVDQPNPDFPNCQLPIASCQLISIPSRLLSAKLDIVIVFLFLFAFCRFVVGFTTGAGAHDDGDQE